MQRKLEEVYEMREFVIITSSSSTEQPYVVAIFPGGDDIGSIVRHKRYGTTDLRQDMKDYLKADDAGADNVLALVKEKGLWAIKVLLSDECAERLGWFE
jgi:hypothetical protein